ncbi:MAG TPA: hypothetical protein VLI72_05530 [Methylibium sp.]|nr:hypothetical protein [Methylibium sp.]
MPINAPLRAACALTLLALGAAALPAHAAADGRRQFDSGAQISKRVVTNTIPLTTTSTSFVGLPGGATRVTVPANRTVLISATLDAETRCSGGETELNWCELQIRIGSLEGNPRASTYGPDTFTFDSTDGGREGIGSWEARSMSRHQCFTNGTASPVNVLVQASWRVTNFGGYAPEFWIDDTAMVVEVSQGCTLTELPSVGTLSTTPSSARTLPREQTPPTPTQQ